MTYKTFKDIFFASRDKRKVIEHLKSYADDFSTLKKIIDRFDIEQPGFRTFVSNAISGDYDLPKSYKELNVNERVLFSGALLKEMNWVTLQLLRKAKIINQFIAARQEFENKLLLGEYGEARLILEQIELSICISYWSIEQRFILDEYQFSYEKNWETRNLILADQNNAFVKGLGNIFSMRAEKRISFFRYNEEFNAWLELEHLTDTSDLTYLVEYLRFKAHYFEQEKYTQLDKILLLEQHASIIDRYIMMVRLSQHILNENQFELPPFLRTIIKELSLYINDPELSNMLFEFGPMSGQLKMQNEQILSVIDLYTTGDYTSCLEQCKNMLSGEYANQPELFELAIKSAIELRVNDVSISSKDSILNHLLQLYYNVLSKNEKSDSSVIELVKYAYTFNTNHLGLKIYSFIKEELGWETVVDYSFLARVSSKFFNPRLWNSINLSKEVTINFFVNFSELFPSSITLKLFNSLDKIFRSETSELDALPLPPIKRDLYIARGLVAREDFASASGVYRSILENQVISTVVKYETISNLYICYKESKDYRNCLILWVNSFIENPHLTKRCETAEVLKQIIRGKFLTIGDRTQLIDLPIFFKVNSSEKVRIKQAYEQFLNANNCMLPSQLILNKDSFNKFKLVFFLRHVCVPEIMQLSKHLASTKQVNEERIAICQFLAEFDAQNADLYNQEIASTTQRNIVSKVIGGIDERKIYVNTDKLKGLLLNNEKTSGVGKDHGAVVSKDLYDRYVSLVVYSREKEYKDIGRILRVDKDSGHFIESEQVEFDSDDYDVVLHIPIFRIFSGFFHFIRDQFIFNNEYGLDAYLSSKIRHGTLPNHLRSVFESFNLVTAQTDGKYSLNKYWDDRLHIPPRFKEEIQLLLADFSKQIDTISRELKEEWIQCKTEKRGADKALFDFTYDRTELMLIFLEDFSDIADYHLFVDKCIQELWSKTEGCLQKIRNKFDVEVKHSFNEIINNLERSLIHTVDKNDIAELLHNINICRTEIQTKLGNISNWFRRSEISINESYSLGTLIDTSIQIIQNINPTYNFYIRTYIESNPIVKGEFHQHIIDVLNILLQNMIEHSFVQGDALQAELSVFEDSDVLAMKLVNSINLEKVNVESLHEKFQYIKNNWTKVDGNVNQDKNSGFPKIKKILRSDLSRKASQFDYFLADDILTITIQFETFGLTSYEYTDN